MTELTNIYNELYTESIVDQTNKNHRNTDKGTTHSYIDQYHKLLSQYRGRKIRVLEIGVQGGISLLMWKRYFPDASVVGVDIDISLVQEKVLTHTNDPNSGIALIKSDAVSKNILSDLDGSFDIIIDDGSHRPNDQIKTFNLLKDRLNVGGIYVIEDVQSIEISEVIAKSIMGCEVIDLRSIKNRFDDIMIIWRSSHLTTVKNCSTIHT